MGQRKPVGVTVEGAEHVHGANAVEVAARLVVAGCRRGRGGIVHEDVERDAGADGGGRSRWPSSGDIEVAEFAPRRSATARPFASANRRRLDAARRRWDEGFGNGGADDGPATVTRAVCVGTENSGCG